MAQPRLDLDFCRKLLWFSSPRSCHDTWSLSGNPFALFIVGPPLLKPNSRKKGTLYYKGATPEPRIQATLVLGTSGGVSNLCPSWGIDFGFSNPKP